MLRATTSASNIARRALCPGSERMEEGLPEEDSAQSEEGRLLHLYAANISLDRRQLSQQHRDLLDINDKVVVEIFRRVNEQFGDEPEIASGAENITWWLHRGIKSLYPGHPDLWEYREGKLLVVPDFKFGYKVVTPATANLQLRSYAAMGAELHDCDHVAVAITQPRLSYDERITLAVYDRDQIAASRQQLYQIWDACKEPDAPLHASEEACRYCKARLAGCPAFEAMIKGPLAALPPISPNGTVAKREAEALSAISKLTPDQRDQLITACKFADFIRDPLHDFEREVIQNGGESLYKLGKGGEVRSVTDVNFAVGVLLSEGISNAKINAASSIKLGPIEEAWRDTKGGTAKDAKSAVNNALASVIERHPKKPSLTRITSTKQLT